MASKLWLGSTQQATDQSNSQELNNEQSSSGTIIEGLQSDSWQHSDTSVSEEQNIDKLLKAVWVWNEILWKKHEFMSLLAENEALEEVSQVGHLPQSRTTPMMSHINQETNTSASVIEKTNAFNTLKSEWLPEYYEKNLREHLNFFCSADTSFNMSTFYFPTERLKIYFTMQYLRGEPWDMWYNRLEELRGPELIKEITFKNFKQFLLDFVEDSMNCQLHHAQLHQNARQRPQQSIQAFASYLKNLEAHISPITKEHHYSILFTKLWPELKVVLTNFQTLPDIFESLVALGARLKQNQW